MPIHSASPKSLQRPGPWSVRGHYYELFECGMIMGIINITPDSFSDGGKFEAADAAIQRALELENEGASIIDFGGESTRPGAKEVSATDEIKRILPAVTGFAENRSPKTLISIDTSKPEVAEAGLHMGADIINDVTGFSNPKMRTVVADSDCGLIIMHMDGNPRTMQIAPCYNNVTEEVISYFKNQIATCESDGISSSRIVIDPGIGFGKNLKHNLELLRSIPKMSVLNRPIMIGVSRKSFIGKLINEDDISHREWPTVALTSYCRERGASIFRVHLVKENVDAMHMTEAILGS